MLCLSDSNIPKLKVFHKLVIGFYRIPVESHTKRPLLLIRQILRVQPIVILLLYAAGHNAVNVFDLMHPRVRAGRFQHHLRRNACILSELLICVDFTGRQNRNCRPVVQLVLVVRLQNLVPVRSVVVRILVLCLDCLV